jgi:hypothetical protein
MSAWRLSHQQYDWPVEFKLYDMGKRVARSIGLRRGPKLEARAAGVALEGTTHNVREAASLAS